MIKAATKPRQLTLTVEQEHTFHYGKQDAYDSLMRTLVLGVGTVELLSTKGRSLHVHHEAS